MLNIKIYSVLLKLSYSVVVVVVGYFLARLNVSKCIQIFDIAKLCNTSNLSANNKSET